MSHEAFFNGSLNLTGWSFVQQVQAYCVNPPDYPCPPFGACPNPDVTGYGQQASVYITEVLFTFLLAFWPEKIHTTIYAHSILILSLHTTAVIALLRGQLTQNDAIFILVLVASPTTLYLWLSMFVRIATRELFKANGSIKVAAFLTGLTLATEIMLILTMYIPSSRINFSQPACFPGYGREVLGEIFWPASLLFQVLFFVVIIGLYFLIFRVLGRPSMLHQIPDVISWLEESMKELAPSTRQPGSVLVPCCLAIIQSQAWFTWIPFPGILAGCQLLICFFGIIWTVCRRRFNVEILLFFGIVLLSAPAFVLPILIRLKTLPQFPQLHTVAPFAPFASGVITTIVCTCSLWKRRKPEAWGRMLTYCILFFIPLVALKFGEAFFSYFNYIEFGISKSYSKDLSLAEHLQNLLFGLFTFASLPWIFVAWHSTSQWVKPPKEQMSVQDIWRATASRAHILKFAVLVVFPNALWIAATIATNPTMSVGSYTIGQTFAIIVSLGNIISVIVDFHEIKVGKWKEVFWAVAKSEQLHWNRHNRFLSTESANHFLPLRDLTLPGPSREPTDTHQYTTVAH